MKRLWYAAILAGLYTLLGGGTTTRAQLDQTYDAVWRFGVGAGANINFVGAGYQNLGVPGFVGNFIPLDVNDGSGVGVYAGLVGEYVSEHWWGAQLRLSLDSRNATLTDITLPVEQEFDISFLYLSIEPQLRISLANTPLHFTAGPLVGIKLAGEFDYDSGVETIPNASGVEIPEANGVTFGISGGAAYDIALGDHGPTKELRQYLTPFFEGSWMLHQRGSSFPTLDQNAFDDIWSTVSLRAGVRFSLGLAPDIETLLVDQAAPSLGITLATPVDGFVRSRKVEEHFPLINYIFFDEGSTQIPARYVKLTPAQAQKFTENDLLDPDDVGNLSSEERLRHQMQTYYNILNIYGARMRKFTIPALTLIGSGGREGDGLKFAESIKNYLVDNHGIEPDRIRLEDRPQPRFPSGSRGTPPEDRPRAAIENRRVELLTNSADLKKAAVIKTIQNSPIDNDLVFSVDDGSQVEAWEVQIAGEDGTWNYGPFDREIEHIDPSEFLADLDQGTYSAKVTVRTADGGVGSETKLFELKRKRNEGAQSGGQRFSILFSYGDSDAVKEYEKFIRSTIAPHADNGSRVIVHGHSDDIGRADGNYRLSVKRANEVRDILRDEIRRSGKSATVEAVGFGERSPRKMFDNGTPEGRFYNRTVIVEIIAPK